MTTTTTKTGWPRSGYETISIEITTKILCFVVSILNGKRTPSGFCATRQQQQQQRHSAKIQVTQNRWEQKDRERQNQERNSFR